MSKLLRTPNYTNQTTSLTHIRSWKSCYLSNVNQVSLWKLTIFCFLKVYAVNRDSLILLSQTLFLKKRYIIPTFKNPQLHKPKKEPRPISGPEKDATFSNVNQVSPWKLTIFLSQRKHCHRDSSFFDSMTLYLKGYTK